MRKKLTKIEEFYIEKNQTASLEELCELMPDVSESIIAKKLGVLKKNTKKNIVGRKGRAVVMTKEQSELGDETLKNTKLHLFDGKITTIYDH